MSANPRFLALETVMNRPATQPYLENENLAQLYARMVFTQEVMRHYLSEAAYQELSQINSGRTVRRAIADEIANAMKRWALSKGATHYTHWFQPLTGLTAEKHDAFYEIKDGHPLETFSGEELVQQEPDASSLPSGGIRSTFEARGYTAWDPSSPAFILDSTLCIPSIFVAYTGEALDFKTPLMRSSEAIDQAATRVCKFFDRSVNRVQTTMGPEQEYFVIDRAFYEARPDLILAGRTLTGKAPARGQQLEDHYFGSMPGRILNFIKDLEEEAIQLGIPVQTRHNEVAPSQFEIAPYFEEMNVAVDHNSLFMDLMEKVAARHDLKALIHEKPFAEINGSGKHNNWSLVTDSGKNLLSPGKSQRDNLQFLTFFVCIIKALYNHADLLRASIASAGNDHRLGANEAPPAILSVFIGSDLEQILAQLAESHEHAGVASKKPLPVNIARMPELLAHNTDRNRTSPFAFTGNKFEFRAVGSSQNCSGPMTVLNTIVAEQLNAFADAVNEKIQKNQQKEEAILATLIGYLPDCNKIIFNGDGYSQEWVAEAARRGLSNIASTPLALDAYASEQTRRLFAGQNVLDSTELAARHNVKLEVYVKRVQIEARVLGELAINQILPAAFNYQRELAENAHAVQNLALSPNPAHPQMAMVQEISDRTTRIRNKVSEMVEARKAANQIEDARARALQYEETVRPFFDTIRYEIDKLEDIVPDAQWPLLKYREMLFLR